VTLTFEHNLDVSRWSDVNQKVKYRSQRSRGSKVIVRTQKHTPDRVGWSTIYLDHQFRQMFS